MSTYYDRFALAVEQTLLNSRCFRTVTKGDLTALWRDASNCNGARLGSDIARQLEDAMNRTGLSAWPSLNDAKPGGFVRIYRTDTVVGRHIEQILRPSAAGDSSLGLALRKIKTAGVAANATMGAGR